MNTKEQNLLKESVKNYWNVASCGTEFIKEKKYSLEYFEAIEEFRYTIEPEIFSFAQFTRFSGKKILEVGVGAGSDFIQWVRAGTQAHGIDLTTEAINNVEQRLTLYKLSAVDLKVADAENLPYKNNYFDLVYSWGVIHHSPNTERCLDEIIRVTKPGGKIKIMVYNRHSLFAFYQYIIFGLFKGKPFQSITKILFNNQESPGTQAYTKKEILKILKSKRVSLHSLQTPVTNHDLLYYHKSNFIKSLVRKFASIVGWNQLGWFLMIDLQKHS